MNDYIKREDAKRVLNKGLRYMRAFGVNRCLPMIDEVQSADVRENIHAKRVIGGGECDGATCWFECSHCHGTVDLQDMFCKHCGAVLEYEK